MSILSADPRTGSNIPVVEYVAIVDCSGPDCADCALHDCNHICHVGRQTWTPVGGWADIQKLHEEI